MTARALAREVGLALSKRGAARLLRVDRTATLDALIARGFLRLVRWGNRWRIPLEDVERLAREGWHLDGPAPRRRPSRRAGPSACDPDALRRLDVEALLTPGGA